MSEDVSVRYYLLTFGQGPRCVRFRDVSVELPEAEWPAGSFLDTLITAGCGYASAVGDLSSVSIRSTRAADIPGPATPQQETAVRRVLRVLGVFLQDCSGLYIY